MKTVIKIGGKALETGQGFKELARALDRVQGGIALVHGGGAEISQALADAKREPKFIDGFRVTQKEDIEIVEKVLSETINSRIANSLQANGIKCQRMSGKTENLFRIKPFTRHGHDYGFVGEIIDVNTEVIEKAFSENTIPIISPISGNEDGDSYNVNADTAAAALGAAIACTDLVFFTDVPGVSIKGKVIRVMSIAEAKNYIQRGDITGGMVAKLESIFHALEQDIKRVHIAQWQGSDTLQKLTTHEKAIGTTIIKDK